MPWDLCAAPIGLAVAEVDIDGVVDDADEVVIVPLLLNVADIVAERAVDSDEATEDARDDATDVVSDAVVGIADILDYLRSQEYVSVCV